MVKRILFILALLGPITIGNSANVSLKNAFPGFAQILKKAYCTLKNRSDFVIHLEKTEPFAFYVGEKHLLKKSNV